MTHYEIKVKLNALTSIYVEANSIEEAEQEALDSLDPDHIEFDVEVIGINKVQEY